MAVETAQAPVAPAQVDPAAPGDESGIPATQILPVSRQSPDEQFRILKKWVLIDQEAHRPWRERAAEEFAFRAGEQWSESDKAILRDQKRPVIVFNRVLTILKAVAGMEINGRHEIQFLPVGVEDTAVNDLLTGASKWMAERTDAEDEESQSFDDCATCGLGWTESRISYDDDPSGMYIEESIDPLEMLWDRGAKKKNLSDRRRTARIRRMPISDALRMFPGKTKEQLDASWASDGPLLSGGRSREEKRKRMDGPGSPAFDPYDDDCEVQVIHIQWKESESYYLVGDPMTQQIAEMTEAEYRLLAVDMMSNFGIKLDAVKMTRTVFKSAFLGGSGMLKAAGPAPLKDKFSWDAITGERDKSPNGTGWFGLVKLLRDPQMWANKWLSQILHMLNSTAKGGIMAEQSAFVDQRQAEQSWARQDVITWMEDGALSGPNPKVKEKIGTTLTDGFMGLMTFAITSFKDVSGINLELLGQQDQNQPGIIEAMRKQAGMTVLATLFDSLRRYRKNVGRSRLYIIQTYLSDGRLIKITNSEGDPEPVRLMKERTTGEYDVIVDDTPTSPNQKEANWLIIQPLMVAFKEQLMANPQIFILLLEYSPLPARVVQGVKTLMEQQMNDPQAQQDQQETKMLTNRLMLAEALKGESVAMLNQAKAGESQSNIAESQSKAMLDMAKAQDLLRQNGFGDQAAMLESISRARRDAADAKLLEAKAGRELVGTQGDLMESQSHAARYHAEAGREQAGAFADQREADSVVVKNLAAAKRQIAEAKNVGASQ